MEVNITNFKNEYEKHFYDLNIEWLNCFFEVEEYDHKILSNAKKYIIDNVIKKFLFLGPEGRKKEPGIGRDRADLIMSGSAIMQTLMRIWPACSMKVADRGLREGILYSLMTADNHFK